jgi:NADP-dependent 3-hydroxy acid dehydrogenase YdfG
VAGLPALAHLVERGPEHVADLMLHTYQMPQNALVQEIVITPTRQKY